MAETKDELPVLPEPTLLGTEVSGHVLECYGHTDEAVRAYATEACAAAQSRINALLEEAQEQAKDHLDSLGVIDRLNSEKAALLEEVERAGESEKRYKKALADIEEACNYSPCRDLNTWDDALAKLIQHHTRLIAVSGRSGSGDGGMG